jgi:DNA-binding transcriptional ArsR family regulator
MQREQSVGEGLEALADPTRRAIVELLSRRSMRAGDIAACFNQQRPAISKHLSLLKASGWLDERRERQQRIYSVRYEALSSLSDWIYGLRGREAPVTASARTRAVGVNQVNLIDDHESHEPTLTRAVPFDLDFD